MTTEARSERDPERLEIVVVRVETTPERELRLLLVERSHPERVFISDIF